MELRPRDIAILRHVALYRLTLAVVIQKVFCAGTRADPTTILGKLVKEGLLRGHTTVSTGALPGRVSYYTLTTAGARAIAAPKDRGEPLGSAALRTHLGVLWFCFLSDRRRYRLEPEDLKELVGEGTPHANIPCCISEEEDGPRIYRVYLSSTDRSKTVKQLQTSISKAWESAEIRPWLTSKDLGFAVLAETRPKCADLEKAIKTASREAGSIWDECHVLVRYSPGPASIKKALEEVDNEGGK